MASDEECTPLYLRAIPEAPPISEQRHAIPPVQPVFDEPSVAPLALTVPPAPGKWLVPVVALAAVAGTFGVLGLLAFILHQGATTGAVADAIAEQRTEVASSPMERTTRLVEPGFDARAAKNAVRRQTQELAARCGAKKAERVRIAVSFQPSGRVSSVDARDRWGDTSEGRCVERALHYLNVTPFAGRKGEVEVIVDIQPADKSLRR